MIIDNDIGNLMCWVVLSFLNLSWLFRNLLIRVIPAELKTQFETKWPALFYFSVNKVLCSTGLWSGPDPADLGWTLISSDRHKAKGRSAFPLHGLRSSPASQARSELRTLGNPLEEQEDKLAKVTHKIVLSTKKKKQKKLIPGKFSYFNVIYLINPGII